MGQIDTSGSRPPQPLTSADYQKRIQIIQNDPRMSKEVKTMLIGRIQSQENGTTPAAPTGGGHP